MKILIFAITLILSINVCAQNGFENTNVFVRVYDLQGKKIGKGKILSISETSLQLNRKGESVKIPVSNIGFIKTKRSGGHNVLIGATSGVVAGAILGSINPPTDSSGGTFTWAGGSSGEEFASGLIVGVISGTIIGGISALFKSPKTFIIDANAEKWDIFVKAVKHNTKNRN